MSQPPDAWRVNAPRFAPGELLAERYRIVRFIDSGGMGEVYEAQDEVLHEPVALKTVRADLAAEPRLLERFKREIQLAHQVTHPNVCRIHDLGSHRVEGGPGEPPRTILFLTMELLQGKTLRDQVAARGRLPPEEALPIAEQVAAGLDAAHGLGIVHRDFKSANVFLAVSRDVRQGLRVVVTDFGLARGLTPGDGLTSLSEAGEMVGTPAYMAPEQVQGKELTAAADVYAFGIVLYEMVTGARPFEGGSPLSVAVRRLVEEPSPPGGLVELPPVWNAAILRCLAREPEQRFASAGEVARALRGAGASAYSITRPVGNGDMRRALAAIEAPRRRRRAALAAALLVAVAAAGWGGLEAWKRRSAQPAAGPTGATSPVAAPAVAPPPPAIAVLAPRPDGVGPENAWIGTALAELLGRALAAGGPLRAIPQDQVVEATADLGLGSGTQPRGEQLARFGRRLGADYGVTGAYTVDAGGLVRLELRLAAAADDRELATSTKAGPTGALAEIALRAAEELRGKLHAVPMPAADQAAVTALLPASATAAAATFDALGALRAGDPSTARRLLEAAVAREPAHALPHATLAAACSELGQWKCAGEQATLALARMRGWSDLDRRAVEALQERAQSRWPEAGDRQRELMQLQPAALEPVLGLVDLQLAAGQPRPALATVEAARKGRQPWAGDPRLDLAAARVRHRLGEPKAARNEAAAAARAARQRDAALSLARARYLEGIALHDLGDERDALTALDDARAAFEARGRRLELAPVLELMAEAQWGQGDLTAAQRLFESAGATFAEAGDRLGAARTRMNLSTVLSERGEDRRAAELASQALAVLRQLGAKQEEAAARLELGARHQEHGDLRAAEIDYREALTLLSVLGDKRQQAVAFTNLGEVLFLRGDLGEAQQLHEEARALNIANGDPTGTAYDTFRLAEVLAARGDLAVAATRYGEALKIQTARGERLAAAETRLGIARLALARGDATGAAGDAATAEEFARAEGAGRLQSLALVTLAEARLAEGKVAEARDAATRARKLASEAGLWEATLAAGRIEARLLATDAAKVDRALAQLAADGRQAEKAGLLLAAFETRLAAAEVTLSAGRTAQGRQLFEGIAQEATRRGLGGIAARARQAAARSSRPS